MKKYIHYTATFNIQDQDEKYTYVDITGDKIQKLLDIVGKKGVVKINDNYYNTAYFMCIKRDDPRSDEEIVTCLLDKQLEVLENSEVRLKRIKETKKNGGLLRDNAEEECTEEIKQIENEIKELNQSLNIKKIQ